MSLITAILCNPSRRNSTPWGSLFLYFICGRTIYFILIVRSSLHTYIICIPHGVHQYVLLTTTYTLVCIIKFNCILYVRKPHVFTGSSVFDDSKSYLCNLYKQLINCTIRIFVSLIMYSCNVILQLYSNRMEIEVGMWESLLLYAYA